MSQIKDLGTEKITPDDSDLIPIQQADGVTRHITKANLLIGVGGSSASALPISFTHWHDESIVESGAAIVTGINANLFYGVEIYQNPAAVNDSFCFYRPLMAGNYRISVLTVKATNVGNFKLEINNTLAFDDFDLYSSAVVANAIINRDVTILSDGLHKFKWTINGKNPSSSNYYFSGRKTWGIKI